MDFLYVKDPHLRIGFQRPVGRTFNFDLEVRRKWDALLSYAKEHGVRHLAIPGDLFDKKTPSDYAFTTIKALADFFEELVSQFTILAIPGNHDLPYSSLDYKASSVYDYFTKKYIKDLTVSGYEEDGVNFVGIPYVNPENTVFDRLASLNAKLGDKFNVVLLHQHFTPWNSQLDFVDFFHYEDLLPYDKMNMFLLGHLHRGYDPSKTVLESGQTQYYLNAWSMVRLVRDYYAVDDIHTPEFYHVTAGESVEYRRVELPHSKYEAAFVYDEVKLDERIQVSLRDFSEALKAVGDSEDPLLAAAEDIRPKVEYYLDCAENSVS